mgnify:FL=1
MVYADKLYHTLMLIVATVGEENNRGEIVAVLRDEPNVDGWMEIGYAPNGNYQVSGTMLQVRIFGEDYTTGGKYGNPCINFVKTDTAPGYKLIRTHGEFHNAVPMLKKKFPDIVDSVLQRV